MGKLVVIEGLDGSGKATQTALLAKRLQADGLPVYEVSFPNYASPSSALVKQYLAGEFGTKPADVNAYAASSFYAVDRFAGWKGAWGEAYRSGKLVLANRYTTANAIHQCAKLPNEERPAFLQWLAHYEYDKLGLPKPDLVLLLDVEAEITRTLMEHRYGGDIGKKDIHERDEAYQQRSRETALWCAQQQGWKVIHCTQNGKMRPQPEIARDVYLQCKEEL